MKSTNKGVRDTTKIVLFQDDTKAEKTIKKLSGELGFPEVRHVLTLYYEGNIVKLMCDINRVYVSRRMLIKSKTEWRDFSLRSSYLGSVINLLAELGCVKASVSNVLQMDFPSFENIRVAYLRGTLISKHQFEITYPRGQELRNKLIKRLVSRSAAVDDISKKISNVSPDVVLDDLGVPNEKIIKFCKKTNLNLNETPKTSYYHRLSSVSNDYSEMSKVFKLLTGVKMTGVTPTPITSIQSLPSASIIIPAFNTGSSIQKTLRSINKQLPLKLKFEVIIVDDGSVIPVEQAVNKVRKNLRFTPIVIRNERNGGISQTRNIGASIANNDILVFIDSDIILTPNYLYEHLARHKLMKKAVFVSFKENVEPDDSRISNVNINRGVLLPKYRNDLRITKHLDSKSMGYYEDNYLSEGNIFSILAETNYFKNLGYGRRIGVFDLPSMVVGHNFSLSKKFFWRIGGFENSFEGYGLEDSYIGIKSISSGAFVVPIVSCGVYHINHSTRRGDLNHLRKEFEQNSQKIAALLSSCE